MVFFPENTEKIVEGDTHPADAPAGQPGSSVRVFP